MKFNMTMTAAEITSLIDICNQIVPDIVDLNSLMPAPGNTKITTFKNQKIRLEYFENSDVVSAEYDLDPDFMVAVFDMFGGFAGNITGACKALMKHGKLLMSIMGAEEIIQKINGMVVGKECDYEGNPLNSEDEDEDSCNNGSPEDEDEDIPQTPWGPDEEPNVSGSEADNEPISNEEAKFETPIADIASQHGFNV